MARARQYRYCSCCRCSTTLTSAGIDETAIHWGKFAFSPISSDCPSCSLYIVQLGFVTEALAKHYVGDGNYHAVGDKWFTDEWVLFGDGTSYERATGRPVNMIITTEVDPSDATLIVPKKIDLDDGAFIWERQSDDPMDPDFLIWKQTTGAKLKDGEGHHYCLEIEAEVRSVGYVWEDGDSHDFTIVTDGTGDDPCNELDLTMCLNLEAEDTAVDGWHIGGGVWTWSDPDDPSCLKSSLLTIYSTEGIAPCGFTGTFGALDVLVQGDCGLGGDPAASAQFRWTECNHDPRECPTIADLALTFTTCDDVTITSIECGDDCADSCAPTDCPAAYCRYQWNVDTQEWDLLDSTCIDPDVCPDPPADPDVTDVAWVRCLCCEVTTPVCPEGETECESTCNWVWSSLIHDWNPTDCVSIGCVCRNKPDTPGEFNGQTVVGKCCVAIG